MTNSDGTLFSQYAERRQYWNADQLPRITGYDYQEDKKKGSAICESTGERQFTVQIAAQVCGSD